VKEHSVSQNELYRSRTQQINASFRAKSAGISLVAVLLIGSYYVVNALALLPSEQAVPDGALSLTLTATILLAIVETVLHIVLFIGAGRIEAYSERDTAVGLAARRNAHVILTAGVFATVAGMFAGFTPFEMGSVLLLGFLLAEIVRFGSQLAYYRATA
jgi:hypothetical protein